MCTVSIVPLDMGVRLVCNRDELKSRPDALAPRVRGVGRRMALFPIDPTGGGTWVGVNDAGLVLALLNRSTSDMREQGDSCARSRGEIVPSLLDYDLLLPALEAARALPVDAFKPFRLLAVQGRVAALLTSDGSRSSSTCLTVHEPLVWTSSSLGDALVERPRALLFEQLVSDAPRHMWVQAQTAFHRHRWRQQPAVSVVMNRPDARTVSRTVVEISNGRIVMQYEPLDDSKFTMQRSLRMAA
jgi:hypothetical protein